MEAEESWRRNTVVCVFPVNAPAVSAAEIHRFVFRDLNLKLEDVEALQLEVGLRKFYIKVKSPNIFAKILEKNFYKFQHPAPCNRVSELIVSDAGGIGAKVLRVFRLPVEMGNEFVHAALAPFGRIQEVICETWSNYEGKGVKNGIRAVKIELKKHVPSYTTIRGIQALILYDGQPKTCRKCGAEGHLFQTCTQRPTPPRRWETAAKNTGGEEGAGQPTSLHHSEPSSRGEGAVAATSLHSSQGSQPRQEGAGEATSLHSEAPAASAGSGGEWSDIDEEGEKIDKEGWEEQRGSRKRRRRKRRKEERKGPEPAPVCTQPEPSDVTSDASPVAQSPVEDPPLTEQQNEQFEKILNFETVMAKKAAPLENVDMMDLIKEVTEHARRGGTCLDWYKKREAKLQRGGPGLEPPAPENRKRKETSPLTSKNKKSASKDDDDMGFGLFD